MYRSVIPVLLVVLALIIVIVSTIAIDVIIVIVIAVIIIIIIIKTCLICDAIIVNTYQLALSLVGRQEKERDSLLFVMAITIQLLLCLCT